MEYTTPTGYRTLLKLPKAIKKHLLEQLQPLKSQPLSYPQLQGSLNFLRSLHTRFHAADYRVAYEVDTKQQ